MLEKAERTLRQRIDASVIDRAQVPGYLKSILSALRELHNCRMVHMDVKPGNIFQVQDTRTGYQVWKLCDMDCCRRFGEPVHGFTAHYAAPELAAAELEGKTPIASDKMDIFSAGLSILELMTGAPLIPKATERDAALTLLSSEHGVSLEAQLNDAMQPLDAAMRSAIGAMLEVNPARRKSAAVVLQTGALSGQVTTTVRRKANEEVLGAMATMKEDIVSEIGEAQARLEEQISAGNQKVLAQVKALEGSLAPASSAVAQAMVELRVAIDEAGEGSEEAREALDRVQTALE